VALAETVRRLAIPKELLLDLLSAFRQDTVKTRYATWDELLDYCRRSADPVGRLVLLVFDHREPDLARFSDRICTALQLANHWQDIAIDLRKDRIYVPHELLLRFGVGEADLRCGRVHDPFRTLMSELVGRTRALFEAGRPLCDRVGRSLRFEMRLTWLGGTRILERIEAVGYDVFARRPRHGLRDKGALAWAALRWRSGVEP
jgi:phytoene synthase